MRLLMQAERGAMDCCCGSVEPSDVSPSSHVHVTRVETFALSGSQSNFLWRCVSGITSFLSANITQDLNWAMLLHPSA